ncbi:MAG TPA: NifU family protein [Terriglobales bacterium]|nr:NifU family protein [Terriglobales bacterium]
MANDKEFRDRVQQIGDLVQRIEGIADPSVRAASKDLVQLLMELHGTALERMMEITFQSGAPGAEIIDQFGQDALVSSLLILYGLHPEPLVTRVERALDRIRPTLRKHRSDVELLAVEEGAVRLRILAGGQSCNSTQKSIQSMIEEAIYEAAPDITSLAIETPETTGTSGFVALEKLLSVPWPVSNAGPSASSVEGTD